MGLVLSIHTYMKQEWGVQQAQNQQGASPSLILYLFLCSAHPTKLRSLTFKGAALNTQI
jgi:hypothetical protein